MKKNNNNNNNNPEVSIIIPTFNRRNLISNAIDSVINQEYTDWELLIIDDHSTDDTSSLIQSYMEKDRRIKYLINSRKKGVSGARNTGIINAKGKYLAFLDSDDKWFSYHLKQSINVLKKEKLDVAFSFWKEFIGGKEYYCDRTEESKELCSKAVSDLNAIVRDDYYIFDINFFKYLFISTFYCYQINTLVIKRDILLDVGLFKESLNICEDTELILRILEVNKFCLLKRHSFLYHIGNDDSLYAFVDRDSLLEKIQYINYDSNVIAENTIKRLVNNGFSELSIIKTKYSLFKKYKDIDDEKEFLAALKERSSIICFGIAYISMKKNKFFAIKFFLKSIKYRFNYYSVIMIVLTLFPLLKRNNENKVPSKLLSML